MSRSQVPATEKDSFLSSSYQSDHTDYNKTNDKQPPSYEVFSTSNSDLPPGWNRLYDPHGKEYFANYITHVTQWEHPGMGSTPYDTNAKMSPPAYDSIIPYPTTFSGIGITIHEDGQQSGNYQSQPSQPSQTPENVSYDMSQHIQPSLELLTPEQLDGVPYRYIPLSKYDHHTTCGQAVCHILRNNIMLTIMSLLMWCLIPTGLILLLVTGNDKAIIALGIAGAVYFFYFCVFICTAGCNPLFLLCCQCRTACASERVVEALGVKAIRSSSIVLNNIEGMIRSDPHLEILVDCSHREARTKRVTDSKGRRSTKTEYHTVTTYKAKRFIPIIRYKDISVQPTIIGDIIDNCPSNTINMTYNYTYELHPTQVPVLEGCMKQMYYDNWWRDDRVDVTVKYCVPGYEDKHVDLLVKERTGGQRACRILCFNPCSFFIMAYLTLYLVYLMLWRRFIRSLEYHNVKYLHIGLPNTDRDHVIYSNPYYRQFHPRYYERRGMFFSQNPQLQMGGRLSKD